MKKIVSLFFMMLVSLFLTTSVFANEASEDLDLSNEIREDLNLDLSEAEITYQDDEITVYSFENNPEAIEKIEEYHERYQDTTSIEDGLLITPLSSVTGPGGTSRITAANSGRAVYWSVKPKTAWPWIFIGEVQLRYHSGFKRDVPVEVKGALGFSGGGIVTMNKNNGGVATLKGIAFALNNQYYRTLPGVSVSFRPN